MSLQGFADTNALSLSGINTITDGAGTIISGGDIQCNTIEVSGAATVGSLKANYSGTLYTLTSQIISYLSTLSADIMTLFNSKAGLADNNTWTGTNVFNTFLPTSTQTPTNSNQLITKTYVDTNFVDIVSAQTITGLKSLSSILMNGGTSSINWNSGVTGQGANNINLGYNCGQSYQGSQAIGIGVSAGNSHQNNYGIAIGYSAGQDTQGDSAIAIGNNSGNYVQGANSIAIGKNAGATSQTAGSIILNASGTAQNASVAGFIANPVRLTAGTTPVIMAYDTTNNEIIRATSTFAPAISGANIGTATTPVAALNTTGTVTLNCSTLSMPNVGTVSSTQSTVNLFTSSITLLNMGVDNSSSVANLRSAIIYIGAGSGTTVYAGNSSYANTTTTTITNSTYNWYALSPIILPPYQSNLWTNAPLYGSGWQTKTLTCSGPTFSSGSATMNFTFYKHGGQITVTWPGVSGLNQTNNAVWSYAITSEVQPYASTGSSQIITQSNTNQAGLCIINSSSISFYGNLNGFNILSGNGNGIVGGQVTYLIATNRWGA